MSFITQPHFLEVYLCTNPQHSVVTCSASNRNETLLYSSSFCFQISSSSSGQESYATLADRTDLIWTPIQKCPSMDQQPVWFVPQLSPDDRWVIFQNHQWPSTWWSRSRKWMAEWPHCPHWRYLTLWSVDGRIAEPKFGYKRFKM